VGGAAMSAGGAAMSVVGAAPVAGTVGAGIIGVPLLLLRGRRRRRQAAPRS
jgi:hypothetical protein